MVPKILIGNRALQDEIINMHTVKELFSPATDDICYCLLHHFKAVAVNRRTDKTMANRERAKEQTMTYTKLHNRIGGVMASVLASSAVDREFEPLSGQIIDYKIGICCFSAKHAALRRKKKRLVGSESENCVRVERHVYSRSVVSVS